MHLLVECFFVVVFFVFFPPCVTDECVVSVQDEASKIKKEASDLDKLIDKTEKEYNDLREDLRGKESEVRKLLEKGKTEQQVSDLSVSLSVSNV